MPEEMEDNGPDHVTAWDNPRPLACRYGPGRPGAVVHVVGRGAPAVNGQLPRLTPEGGNES